MKIKTEKVILNTGDTGKANKLTKPLNGFLECVVIVPNDKISVKIDLYQIINIYNDPSVTGVVYLPLRTHGLNNRGERINYSSEKYILSGPLFIEVKGGKNIGVEVLIKYS